jgi:hypothetical protein
MSRLYASRVTPVAASASDLLRGIAKLGEHVRRVRTERGRRVVMTDALGVDLERQRECLPACKLLDDSHGARLLMTGSLRNALHRRDGDSLEHVEPMR